MTAKMWNMFPFFLKTKYNKIKYNKIKKIVLKVEKADQEKVNSPKRRHKNQ